jgi:hypothetical protein
MEMTVKQNINAKSIVLKHKIALGASLMLEERELTLDTDAELYTMVSVVNNFIEENLLDLIEADEREFAEILEADVEPLFDKIITDYNYKETFDEIVATVVNYLDSLQYRRNTVIGLINMVIDFLSDQNWEDLEFFFNDLKQRGSSLLTSLVTDLPKTETKKVIQRTNQEQFDGASEKIKDLIEKFQKQTPTQEASNE